jgi:hypothetical protein
MLAKGEEMSPFHRNQERIDAIARLIQSLKLLKDKDIHQLAHDCGDIEDAAFYLAQSLDELHSALKQFETNPKECWLAFLSFGGHFDDCRGHMKSADRLIMKACREIERRYPQINPPEEEEE